MLIVGRMGCTVDMAAWTVWDASWTTSDALLVKWLASATAALFLTPLSFSACHTSRGLVPIKACGIAWGATMPGHQSMSPGYRNA